jgi:hypothetical protein
METLPQADAAPAPPRIWRSENCLVLFKDARLPERCVLCNVPTSNGKITKRIFWTPRMLIFSIAWVVWLLNGFLGLFFPQPTFAIAARFLMALSLFTIPFVLKTRAFQYCLCPAHQARRRRTMGISLVLLLLFTVIFVGILTSYPMPIGDTHPLLAVLAALMPVCALLTLLYWAHGMRTVYPAPPLIGRSDANKIFVTGFCPEFMEEFPDYRNGLACTGPFLQPE